MHVKLLSSEAFFQPKMKKYCWAAGPGPAEEQLERFPRPPSWIKFSQGEAYPRTPIKRITVKLKLNVMNVFVLMISNATSLYIKRGKVSVTYVRDGGRGQLSSE